MTTEEASRILDFWEAAQTVVPVPNPWMQSASVCYEVAELRQTLLGLFGGERTDPKPEDFLPPTYKPYPKSIPEKHQISVEDELERLRARMGLKNVR